MKTIDNSEETEKKLKENDAKYRLFFENNCATILFVDPISGEIIFANEAAIIFYGYSKEQLTNMNIAEIITLSEEEIKAKRLIAIKQKQNYFELKHKLANGEICDVEVYQTKLIYDNKEIFSAIIHDVTGKKKTEDELRKFSIAVEQSPSVFAITDVKGNIEYVNPKFTEITGYTKEEAIGINPGILRSGKQPDEMYKKLWEIISSGKKWRGEFHNKKKNGEYFWEFASISPIFNKEGKIVNYIKISEDITKRKEMEKKLIENELRFRNLSNLTLEAILIHKEGVVYDANEAFVKMFGYEYDEFVSKNIIQLFAPESSKEIILEKIKEEHTKPYEVDLKRKDGSIITVEIESRNISLDNEAFRVTALRDMTEKKKNQEELKKYQNHLEELVEERTSDLEEINKDLEKFNDLFVGRELRIKELRDELQKYKDKYENT